MMNETLMSDVRRPRCRITHLQNNTQYTTWIWNAEHCSTRLHIDSADIQYSYLCLFWNTPFLIFLTVPHRLNSSLTLKHMRPHTYTQTYQSGIIAKHTDTHYIWTVSPRDQTHVDSLTFDPRGNDYSSSSSLDCSFRLLCRYTHTLESIRCLLLL